MPDKVYVGRKCQSFQSYGEYQPFSGVRLWRDDDTSFFAGDDTGRVMETEHRSASQSMADNILKGIKGYVYRPFEAKGCELDPAAELGDAVTICGTYTMIGSMRKNYKNGGLVDLGLPGGKEINHEYPYKSAQDRELKRRVKLGQAYQGVKIDRLNGLTITETDGETDGARVVLNSRELTFYDVGGGKVLYFDPVSKTSKFMGELNVNNNFIVDKLGNVVMKGGITLDGAIKWGTNNTPNKKRYAASTSGPWHDTMQSGDIYCCDWDYTAETWGEAYQFKGQDGRPGSDANVPGYIKSTYIDMTGVTAPYIKANLMTVQTPDQSLQVNPSESGFLLTGYFNHKEYEWFKISYFEGDGPNVNITSPASAAINIGSYEKRLLLLGQVSFASANSIYWGKNAPTLVLA